VGEGFLLRFRLSIGMESAGVQKRAPESKRLSSKRVFLCLVRPADARSVKILLVPQWDNTMTGEPKGATGDDRWVYRKEVYTPRANGRREINTQGPYWDAPLHWGTAATDQERDHCAVLGRARVQN
jgi:hypothetical protein